MKTKTCLICQEHLPSKLENHLCDKCIEEGKLFARIDKKKKKKKIKNESRRSLWLSFIGLDDRIVNEIRIRFEKRFGHSEPSTYDEDEFIQHLLLTYTKSRKKFNPRHSSRASFSTFINRAFDRGTKYLDRTRLSASPVIELYTNDVKLIREADWFIIATKMADEHYRQENTQRKYYQRPTHISLGKRLINFAEEPWGDASSLKSRIAESLKTLTSRQRTIFELLAADHTQQEIADKLGISQSWTSDLVKVIRLHFGWIEKKLQN